MAFFEQKMQIIQCYKSQFFDPISKEPDTPISGKHFLESIKSKNITFGRAASLDYAEGFTVNRTIGVQNLFDLL